MSSANFELLSNSSYALKPGKDQHAMNSDPDRSLYYLAGRALGVVLIVLGVGLLSATFVFVLWGEWDHARQTFLAFAMIVAGIIVVGLAAVWFQEWLTMPDRPGFTDGQLDRMLEQSRTEPWIEDDE